MKRLVASGMPAIYQICPAFRRGDRGELHNVEFAMLEWYRVGVDYQGGRDFLAEFVQTVAQKFLAENATPAPWTRAVEQKTFREVFLDATGIDPRVCEVSELRALADVKRIVYPESYASGDATTRDDWLDLVFSELVQPNLGFEDATIVYDYPATQSQLAKTDEIVDPTTGAKLAVSRRFELFVEGIELANGYDELLDPGVLRERVAKTTEVRRRDGSKELPQESRLLAAMEAGLPECSGCALGVDRLLMALLDKRRIDEVLAFPIELA